jgi:serine/threonine-protein kinase HipA
LESGELCYITERIDRDKKGGKLHMIDFLQILELENKYMGSMEMLGKEIARLSANEMLDKVRYFELTVFNYIIGNNDMHLKNFSMLLSTMGWVLAPAYDLLNVKLVLPKDDDDTALLLGGKKKNFKKSYFDRFGQVLGLNDKQVNNVYSNFIKALPAAIQLIENSFLADDYKTQYCALVENRAKLFEREN